MDKIPVEKFFEKKAFSVILCPLFLPKDGPYLRESFCPFDRGGCPNRAWMML